MGSDRIGCVDPARSVEDLEHLRRRLAENDALLRSRSDHYLLLGGATRLKILALLECAGELCVCDLAMILEMTPAAVSQHLGRLRSAALVAPRRDKMTIFYRRTDSDLLPPLCFPALGPG
ncbi:MAG: helix-turn-helix transcriptional regulator [Acidobacteria bacterium]|nr:helix-turn-helix transcriptional regulator [Acidobacteriota bacterium]